MKDFARLETDGRGGHCEAWNGRQAGWLRNCAPLQLSRPATRWHPTRTDDVWLHPSRSARLHAGAALRESRRTKHGSHHGDSTVCEAPARVVDTSDNPEWLIIQGCPCGGYRDRAELVASVV